MTAKTRHGKAAHHRAHGSDPGSKHERLNRMHAMPGRPEGAPMGGQGPMAAPPPAPPPAMGEPPMGAAPMESPAMGAGPSTSDDGEQS